MCNILKDVRKDSPSVTKYKKGLDILHPFLVLSVVFPKGRFFFLGGDGYEVSLPTRFSFCFYCAFL